MSAWRHQCRLLGACLCAIAALAAASFTTRDVLLYNPSGSVAQGFYARSREPISLGALVTVRARDVAPQYAAARDFTDPGDRFIKRIAATRGQVVCAEGAEITIDGLARARRLERDSAGRALPSWSGCRTLASDEVLLLGETPDSFDGRYWGPIDRRLIEGVWRPIWIKRGGLGGGAA